MKKICNAWLAGLLAIILLTACYNAKKLIERGSFDEALVKSLHKIQKKKDIKPKYIADAEEAYYLANEQDMADIDKWRNSNKDYKWEKIFDLTQDISERQDLVRSYLPHVQRKNEELTVKFINISPLRKEAADKAAENLYEKGVTMLIEGKNGNKSSARSAYTLFKNIDKYRKNFKNSGALKSDAVELGTTHVLFNWELNRFVRLPWSSEQMFNEMVIPLKSDSWDPTLFQ